MGKVSEAIRAVRQHTERLLGDNLELMHKMIVIPDLPNANILYASESTTVVFAFLEHSFGAKTHENIAGEIRVISGTLQFKKNGDRPINVNAGHAVENASRCIDTFRDKIVEIHASGVSRGIDHFPLEMNDKVDYPLIMNKLNEIEYQGPIIFEICYARTINDIIAYCKSAKKEIVSYWNQA